MQKYFYLVLLIIFTFSFNISSSYSQSSCADNAPINEFLTTMNVHNVTDSLTIDRHLVVEFAKQLLGSKRCRAAGPDCFDCSGLAQFVYKNAANIDLPRVSADQYGCANGKKIDKSQIKPGDLLFFDTKRDGKKRVTHVGIYIGNGKMVHSSSTSKKVVETDVFRGYYRNTFVGIKKYLN